VRLGNWQLRILPTRRFRRESRLLPSRVVSADPDPTPPRTTSRRAQRMAAPPSAQTSHIRPSTALRLVLTTTVTRYTHSIHSSNCLPCCLTVTPGSTFASLLSPLPVTYSPHPTRTRPYSAIGSSALRAACACALHPLVHSSSHHHLTFPSSHPPTPDQPPFLPPLAASP